MRKLKQLAMFAAVSAVCSAPTYAFAQTSAAGGDTGKKPEDKKKPDKKPEKLPFHGSVFFIDQSATTQTLGIGDDYQSRNPTYELQYSFRPKWYFYEGENDSFDVGLRFDMYQELTNSDGSTKEREPQFGDPSLSATYGHVFHKDKKGFLTKVSGGPRFGFGTSKASVARGSYGSVGVGAAVVQAFPVAGVESDVFPGGDVAVNFGYTKALSRCTTPCSADFGYQRQDIGGRTITSDQLSPGAMTDYSLSAGVAAGLGITQRLKLGLSYAWTLQYVYPLGDQSSNVQPASGQTIPAEHVPDPTHFRVAPFVSASLDYDLIDEVGLGVGYYNVTPQIGPDATRRNPLWSPDARFFFTVTANLDAIYDTASGRNKPTASASRGVTTGRVQRSTQSE